MSCSYSDTLYQCINNATENGNVFTVMLMVDALAEKISKGELDEARMHALIDKAMEKKNEAVAVYLRHAVTLLKATMKNDARLVDSILSKNPGLVRSGSTLGRTLMRQAVTGHHVDVFRCLLTYGVSMD